MDHDVCGAELNGLIKRAMKLYQRGYRWVDTTSTRIECGRSTDDVCPLCLDSFVESEPVFVTSCQHRFHIVCMQCLCLTEEDKPLRCPLCRSTVIL